MILVETVRVSRKYQIVIPKRAREMLRIGPGDELVVWVRGGQIVMRPKPKSYAEYMRGLHREVWRDVEAEEYVREERERWLRKGSSKVC